MNVLGLFQEITLGGYLDIAFMSLLIYLLLVWFKRTRAAFVLTGVLIVAGIYLLTRQFDLPMTAAVFEKFFAVIFIALVVIFQEELRHFFERIAVWSLNRRLTRRKAIRMTRNEVDVIVRTLLDLASERIGALIVIRGQDMIVRHLDGGIDLNGELSEQVLKSIFDPSSVGHDGAVVIEGKRIAQFACHLPLSKDLKKVGKGGTRHAAALGLVELSDALCLVVSEERGEVSVARRGNIEVIKSPERLQVILERFYQDIHPREKSRPIQDLVTKNWKEKILAIILAMALWFVLIYGAKTTYRVISVPVSHAQLPEEWQVENITPKEVDATFLGPRSAFYFLGRKPISFHINVDLKEGTQEIPVSYRELSYPKNMLLDRIYPSEVSVKLHKKTIKDNGEPAKE